MKTALLAAVAALSSGAALAQGNNQLSSGGGVLAAVTPAQVIAIFNEIGSTATLAASEGDQHVVEITTEGIVTYVLLRACTGAGQAAKCLLAQSFAKFDNFGTTLALANSINIQKMRVSTVMLLPDESTLVGAKVIIDGGITETNLGNNLGLFFLDLGDFAEASQGGPTQVKLDKGAAGSLKHPAAIGAEGFRIRATPQSAVALHAVGARLTPKE